jgi:UDP-N-acetylmuramate: L-alanyl-gamma-D-glutamyl-meso-diaminopimelate ligase
VLTGIEFDHADIYRDLEHVKESFRRLVLGLPAGSLLVACDRAPDVDTVLAGTPATVLRYGHDDASDWRLGTVTVDPPWTRFRVLKAGATFADFRTRMIGAHNLLNALADIAVADHIGLSAAEVGAALAGFGGVKRRQEIRGEKRGIVVMDDFAHHPTAVAATIAAVRSSYPGRRLVAVFEPRTNSSMRRVFQRAYAESFDQADLVCIRRPSMLEKVPEAERFSSETLAADLAGRGRRAHFFADTAGIVDFLVGEGRPGDVVLIMSNGGFDNIHETLLESL